MVLLRTRNSNIFYRKSGVDAVNSAVRQPVVTRLPDR